MSPSGSPPPPELIEFVTAKLGAVEATHDLSWDHGESAVWLVRAGRGRALLKAHRQRRKFEQELTAYRDWLPRLRASRGASVRQDAPGIVSRYAKHDVGVPELLAWRELPPRALLIGFEEGELVERLELEPRRERDVHQRAGAFLRALHELEVRDHDPVPLADAFRQRLDAWSARARDAMVPEGVIANVGSAAAEALPALAHAARSPCHRDYSPRNWLLREGGRLMIIDFEHARPDMFLTDFERLFTGLWRRRDDLREAFMAGYGRDLSADELGTLRRIAALGALSTVAWARAHADGRFEQHGWDVLRWLGLAEDAASGTAGAAS